MGAADKQKQFDRVHQTLLKFMSNQFKFNNRAPEARTCPLLHSDMPPLLPV